MKAYDLAASSMFWEKVKEKKDKKRMSSPETSKNADGSDRTEDGE